MENVRQHRNNKLATTERRRNYLVSKTKLSQRKFISYRNEKNSNPNEYACLFRFINTGSR